MIKSQRVRFFYTYFLPLNTRKLIETLVVGRYPRIFDERKFVFIHIPKTAGKSIGRLIGLKGACHLTMSEYEVLIGREALQEYFLFSVLRDPAAKIISAWSYIMAGGNQSKEDRELRKKLRKDAGSLERFILELLEDEEYMNLKLFLSQRRYLSLSDGSLPENLYLMHIDRLLQDVKFLPKHVVIREPKLTCENRSRSVDYSLSSAALNKIKEVYEADYRLIECVEEKGSVIL